MTMMSHKDLESCSRWDYIKRQKQLPNRRIGADLKTRAYIYFRFLLFTERCKKLTDYSFFKNHHFNSGAFEKYFIV